MFNWLGKIRQAVQDTKDIVLVTRAKQGDADAFGALYLKYIDSIYRYVFFRVDQKEQDAEDICEIVFLKAWQSLNSFSTHGNVRAWLYRIAHNAVIDYYRTQKKESAFDEQITQTQSDIFEKMHQEDQIQEVINALELLTKEQKEVITMRFIEDMSIHEIAHILKKREDAVRALSYRGLKQLKKQL